jgi:hypothetical protein
MLLRYAVAVCPVDGLVLNNLDQLPEPIPLCTVYKDQSDLTLPGSLKQQEELTKQLESAQPVIAKVSKSEFLDCLGEIAPVVLTADGPTHLDRRWMANQTVLNPAKKLER